MIEVGAPPSHVDLQVASIRPTELLQPSPKSRQPKLALQIIAGADQNTNSPRALLRARRQRPRRRAADQRDDLATAAHSITSSARTRNDSGIVSPIAFAVLLFTISSNLVACSTGRSAGLAPFRILST